MWALRKTDSPRPRFRIQGCPSNEQPCRR